LQNAIDILHDLGIRKSDCSVAFTGKSAIPVVVVIRIMRIAIDLDDQSLRRAKKIGDIRSDDCLTAELEAA